MGTVAVVDHGLGNIRSVCHALQHLGADAAILHDPAGLADADRIVLPGVGSFRDCMANLAQLGFVEALHEAVRDRGIPVLGICLGMQVMARRGEEGGEVAGLGWIDGEVRKIEPADKTLRVPHIGWNSVRARPASALFAGVPADADFYFVHSYAMSCGEEDAEATCDHGGPFVAAVRRGNVFGTQFHPEKSQDHGLRILDNFLVWRA
ncbi:MAG: imidazole glycerol phosphate synthase subunit HisH [Methanobacteriota archaeon]